MGASDRRDLAAALLTPGGIQDPYPIYARLRETAPVGWSPAFGAWIVTSYAAVREVLRSHDRFSSELSLATHYGTLPAEVRAQMPTVELLQHLHALPFVDAPRHSAQRAAVMRPLTPRQLESRRPWIGELCEELAAGLAAEPRPDLIAHFSSQLSNRSLLALFGAPPEHTEVYQAARHATRLSSPTAVPARSPHCVTSRRRPGCGRRSSRCPRRWWARTTAPSSARW